LQQPRGRRRGHRKHPVFAFHDTAPDIDGRRDDLRRAEPLEPEYRADDVHDRIEGANFVQVDSFNRYVVYRRLGISQTAKQLYGAILSITREAGLLDRGGNLFQAVMTAGRRPARGMTGVLFVIMCVIVIVCVDVIIVIMMMVVMLRVRRGGLLKPELRRGHTGPEDPLRANRVRVQRQTPESLAQLRDRQPDVEQRAEHHVSGRSGETIEVRGFRHVRAFPSHEN
jgi:hypothetical protein